MTDREKILDKLIKIKAHAESAAKIGSEAEAEAFAAMLQQLLLRHKIDMTDLEIEKEEAEEPVDKYTIDWQDVKVRGARIAWIERLAGIVARAYFCRILVHPNSSRITLVGRKSDAAVAEFMIVTLVRAAEQLARKEYGKVFRMDKYAARGFMPSFLKSFTVRIAERIEDERRTASTSTSTALVRINRAESAVTDFMKQFTKKAAMVRGSRDDGNAEGYRRGRAMADAINLNAGSRAVETGSTTARSLLK